MILFIDLDAQIVPLQRLRSHEGGSAATKRIKNQMAGACRQFDKGLHQSHRFLCRVQTAVLCFGLDLDDVVW